MVTGDWDMLEDGQQGTDSGRPSEAEKVPAILLCAVPLSQDCGSVWPRSARRAQIWGSMRHHHPLILLTFSHCFG